MPEPRIEQQRRTATPLFVVSGIVAAVVAGVITLRTGSEAPSDATPSSAASVLQPPASSASPTASEATTPALNPPEAAIEVPGAMVRVPAGVLMLGSNDGEADEKPVHRVKLATFEIDRTEVTVKAYAACVAAGACEARTTVNGDWFANNGGVEKWSIACNYGKAGRAAHPMNCVDWNDATKFCKWAGKRLPTEVEWEYAARGSDSRAYPWGNESPTAQRLNACGSECTLWVKVTHGSINWDRLYAEDDGWATTAPVGSYASGVSPYGLMDMAGNVWEWTSSGYSDRYGGKPVVDQYVLRGGSWNNGLPGRFRAANRDRGSATDRFDYLGLRCAR